MFWGLVIEAGKRYTKVVDNPFHISAAVLDTSSLDDELVRVIVEVDECETLIANLSLKHGVLQSQLDLQFESGSHVAFYTTGGKSPVHLSGYVVFDDEEVYGDEEQDGKDTSDEDVPDLVSGSIINEKTAVTEGTKELKNKTADQELKRKTEDKLGHSSKKAKLIDYREQLTMEHFNVNADTSDDDSSDSEEEDSDLDENELPNFAFPVVKKMQDEVKLDGDKKEEDISNKLHKTPTLVTEVTVFKDEKTPNSKKKAPMTEAQDLRAGAPTPKTKKIPKSEKKSPVNETQTSKAVPAHKSEMSLKSEKKIPMPETQTPKTDDKICKKKSTKQMENLAERSEKIKSLHGTSPSRKVVKPGGVTCEDLFIGTGLEAKHGKMVSVYYEGRLLNSKMMFDKCDSGKGLKFRLGYGEVISGWDVGVTGMKVGGKRKIICPPHMAYGKKGIPGIPPQSTLVFVVELKCVH